APSGSIFYTVDGNDPRLVGGDLSDSALVYENPIPLEDHVTVKSRTRNGSVWSPLNEASFQIIQSFQDLMITEIMFNPKGDEDAEGNEYEFIELRNIGTDTLPLSGIHFAAGIQYTFPPNTFLAPNEFSVLVSNQDAFLRRYPEALFQGVYQGQLDNNGELIQLLHAIGTPIVSVRYSDDPPWPQITDGFGFSLESVSTDTISDPTLPESWRPSIDIGGSPGRITSLEPTPEITINEILSHTDPPQVDSVELHNSTTEIVDLTGWFLTDDLDNIRKFRIPEESLIAPNGFIVFDENDFNPVPRQAGSFALSSHGEQIHLFSADPAGNLTGYHHGVEFGASPTSISFGRITTSTGTEYFPLQIVSTLGARNLGPSIGPVIFTEIHYNPDDSQEEFLELKNVSNIRVPLFHSGPPPSTWTISGIGYHFPQGTFLEPGEIILVIPVNPEVFKSRFTVAPNTRLFGPYTGRLDNKGESLEIRRPGNPDIDASGIPFTPFITIDAINYGVTAPWPIGNDRTGRSLERISLSSFGNDPVEWRASFGFPTPGFLPRSNRAPFVDAGNDQDMFSGIFPVEIQLNGQASDDGLPANPGRIAINWQLLEGPASVVFEDIQSTRTLAHFLVSGVYRLQLQANDGRLQSTDELIIEISRPQEDFTFIPLQSDWKYLDTGINPGPNWTLRRFDDGSWKSGPAQLGYGDGDEQTIISFGPNASSKFITSYFRYAFTTSFSDVVESVKLQLLRDDGAVVYLNGSEIFRSNLPAGPISAGTTALEPIGGDAEGVFVETDVDPGLIVDGLNVLAVEI
ncbi:MAG TPA: hypothetical protein EYG38_07695, partial [Verrucomicrobia bacterium]|nr:hypothetical protein [Verrucomicrobiota bacterium]